MKKIIDKIELPQLKKYPSFSSGDTVEVLVKVKEGKRENTISSKIKEEERAARINTNQKEPERTEKLFIRKASWNEPT